MSAKIKWRKRKCDVGGHVFISKMPSVLMPPTQFGLRPWYPCEHPCVQTQSDHLRRCSGLRGLVRHTVFEHACASVRR